MLKVVLKMESAVIYARFSSHGQNEQSIEAQVRICKEFAESKGLKVINVYTDKARTGTNDARPGFQRMIADAKSGAFRYIIVYMFDRFARNRHDSIVYKEMLREKYNVRVISALEPIAEDEGGEFYEMFLEWNAEKYSKRLSKRVKDGLDTSVAIFSCLDSADETVYAPTAKDKANHSVWLTIRSISSRRHR